jgi:carbonic anhydrase
MFLIDCFKFNDKLYRFGFTWQLFVFIIPLLLQVGTGNLPLWLLILYNFYIQILNFTFAKKYYRYYLFNDAPTIVKEDQIDKLGATKAARDLHTNALFDGNIKYHESINANPELKSKLASLAIKQYPHTVVVTCSDSRICPEKAFGANVGEIFVVRTAGNTIDEQTLGAIEFSILTFQSSSIIVMGHTRCGAVEAAIANSRPTPYISKIIDNIRPAVKKVKKSDSASNDILLSAIEENVALQISKIRKSGLVQKLEKQDKLSIIPCIYEVETGRVRKL